jgi:hypothetical protein
MEFLNVVRELNGEPAIYANKSKNTTIYVLRFSMDNGKLRSAMLVDNDASHLETNEEESKVTS